MDKRRELEEAARRGEKREELEDPARRGQNVDPGNTYSTQNRGATMREPRAEERIPFGEERAIEEEAAAPRTQERVQSGEDRITTRGQRQMLNTPHDRLEPTADSGARTGVQIPRDRENRPETTDARVADAENRTEGREDMSHRMGGRDAAVREEKPMVADSGAQRPDEDRGDEFERRES